MKSFKEQADKLIKLLDKDKKISKQLDKCPMDNYTKYCKLERQYIKIPTLEIIASVKTLIKSGEYFLMILNTYDLWSFEEGHLIKKIIEESIRKLKYALRGISE